QRRSPLRHATLRFVDHPGKPHRTGLDKRPTKFRELKREPAFDQSFTSAGGDEAKTHESKGVRIVSGLRQSNDLLVAVADMDRNGHIQTFRFPVKRMEIRIDQ